MCCCVLRSHVDLMEINAEQSGATYKPSGRYREVLSISRVSEEQHAVSK